MNYPIVIFKEKKSDFGVVVPDLPGCFSAGATVDEALEMAKEAIELHIEGLIEEGLSVPSPGAIEEHRKNSDFADGTWAVVQIDASSLRLRAKRINITMPERVLEAVDRVARATHDTRSGLLAKAASRFVREGAVIKNRVKSRKRESVKTS